MTSSFTHRAIKFDDWREKVFFTIAGVCAVAIVAVVTWIAINLVTWSREETVPGPVTVSSQWVEFSPRKPLVPAKQYQLIFLEVDPAEALVVDNSHLERIQFGNGEVKPEIQLVDSQGNVFVAEVYRSPVPSYLDNSIVGNIRDCPKTASTPKFASGATAPFV